jgi:peptidoglycan/LPS O-acetylase OafA/YrhL
MQSCSRVAEVKKSPLQIPSLDGIRAISFLLVFLAHIGLENIVPGGLGVTIFFFLSGYLITTLMREEHAATSEVSFRQFYLRRALRILPPFYTVLAVGALATASGLITAALDPRVLAAQALHFVNYWTVAHGWNGEIPGTGVYWSLAVEEHFYLLFPMIFVVLHRWRATPLRRATALWVGCAAILAWRCWLVYGLGSVPDRTYLASDTRFDSILLGCALALVGNPALDAERPGDRRLWLGVLLPAGALLMLSSLLIREARFRETFRYSMQGLALYPLFITAVRYPGWGPYRLLNSRVLRRIGVLSYSLYLQHHVVIFALRQHLPGGSVLRGVAALAASLAIASLMWRFIEQPAARLRKRFSSVAREADAPLLAGAGAPPA